MEMGLPDLSKHAEGPPVHISIIAFRSYRIEICFKELSILLPVLVFMHFISKIIMKVDYGNVYQIWIIHKSGKSTFYSVPLKEETECVSRNGPDLAKRSLYAWALYSNVFVA